MDTSTSSALQGCVASLRSGMQLLESSIAILDSGVADYPRLSRVLQTTRHFELLPESSLLTAQHAVKSEIQPEISALLARVEAHLEKLERKDKGLIARYELQEGRLGQSSSRTSGGARASGGRAEASKSGALEEMKMQALRQKKERLSYAVGRLELQASQRQRQLRKSMAAQ